MTTKALTMYVAQCDYPGCEVETRDFDKGDHIVYDTPENLAQAFDQYRWGDGGGLDDWGWLAAGDKHYCGDHTDWDEETDKRVPLPPPNRVKGSRS